MDIWKDKELTDLVIAAWRAGESASDIARGIAKKGLTRSAVLGKMKRMGIKHGEAVAQTCPPGFQLGSNSRYGRKDRFEFTADADIAIIREVEAGRHTEAEIADLVGCNANQIHTRIGLLRKAGHLAAPVSRAKSGKKGNLKGGNWAFRSGAANYHPVKVSAYCDKGPDPMAPPPALDDRGARYSILSIKDGKCRWPHGDPSAADFHLCGNPGAPYCPYHMERRKARATKFDEDQEAA